MKSIKRLLLILFGAILVQSAIAQNPLRITLQNSFPTNATLGDTFSFDVGIINDSTTTFKSTIGLAYSVNGIQIDTSSSSKGFQFTTQFDSLPQGNSSSRTVLANVSDPPFIAGPSVVVIWPIATNAYARDSLIFQILIQDTNTAGIHTAEDKSIRAFVWNNNLQIQRQEGIQLKRVRIYDLQGREILNQPNPADRTTLPQMITGIYLAEITYNNNKRVVFRFYQ